MSAKITLKGYLNKPTTRTSGKGREYVTYSIRAKTGKDSNGNPTHAYFNCMDFTGNAPPADGSFVTLTGGLNPRPYDKDGEKRVSLDVFVDSVEAAPPRDGGNSPSGEQPDLSWMDAE